MCLRFTACVLALAFTTIGCSKKPEECKVLIGVIDDDDQKIGHALSLGAHASKAAEIQAVATELKGMVRADIAAASWRDNGCIILVPDLAVSAPIVDRIAAEHVELAMDMAPAEALAARIRHAGAIFIGRHTPEAIGDYVAGTNHVLPTSRAARFSGGLGVADFLKRTSLVSCTPEALAALGPAALALAEAEGLGAHGRSVSIRLNRRG